MGEESEVDSRAVVDEQDCCANDVGTKQVAAKGRTKVTRKDNRIVDECECMTTTAARYVQIII
jgi:hypothetical protein